MAKKKPKDVYIKLGSNCNLCCKYCHAEKDPFQFNPEILPILKEHNVKSIRFGGGEPLLYWDTIKQVVNYLGDNVKYKIISNGTLFTDEIVNFCNEHHIMVNISVDGINTARDISKPIQWECISKLWLSTSVVTFYEETKDIRKSLESLNEIKQKYLTVKPFIWSSFPNFIHSTKKTGILSTRKLAEEYVLQITQLADEAFNNYVTMFKRQSIPIFLRRIFLEFIEIKNTNGIACCNENNICILADGTICACPYTHEKVGDIFNLEKINWNKIKNDYIHEKCKTCSIFNICRNRCYAETTDNLCYIMRKMNKNIKELMEKYDISYNEYYNKCLMRNNIWPR